MNLKTTFGAEPFQLRLPNAPDDAPDNWALYDQFLDLCESNRWKMSDLRKKIESVDPATLTDNDRNVIDCIGEVAVVEGNAPSIVSNQLAIMLHDAEFSAWATYQVGEEAKHFHSVRHYCRHVGHPMASRHTERHLVEAQKGFDPNDFQDQYSIILINIFGETLNIHLYQVLASIADEPVLKAMLQQISRDERRHQQWFVAYFRKRAAQDPQWRANALLSLKRMLHMGEETTGDMQQHQGTGARNYLLATQKLIKYGYSLKVITLTVAEQWKILEAQFGGVLDFTRSAFISKQLARPETVEQRISAG